MDLAKHFLSDYENAGKLEHEQLATEIQSAVEDWFMSHPDLQSKKMEP